MLIDFPTKHFEYRWGHVRIESMFATTLPIHTEINIALVLHLKQKLTLLRTQATKMVPWWLLCAAHANNELIISGHRILAFWESVNFDLKIVYRCLHYFLIPICAHGWVEASPRSSSRQAGLQPRGLIWEFQWIHSP